MYQAQFRFYADLNYFLPPGQRQTPVKYAFHGRPAIKDAIEALGIPHPEVDFILVDGVPVDFDYHLQAGDRVGVYPFFQSLELPLYIRLRATRQGPAQFVLDIHLGRLAAYLRLLGFDALYRNDYQDDQMAAIASKQGRILLTRDRGLLKRSEVRYGYCLRSSQPREQVLEILRRFQLGADIKPLIRCLRCNGMLATVHKGEVKEMLPDSVREEHQDFRQCQGCGQIYWRGSHYDRLNAFLKGLLATLGLN
jgi:uncharacterized protein with PIN domain